MRYALLWRDAFLVVGEDTRGVVAAVTQLLHFERHLHDEVGHQPVDLPNVELLKRNEMRTNQ